MVPLLKKEFYFIGKSFFIFMLVVGNIINSHSFIIIMAYSVLTSIVMSGQRSKFERIVNCLPQTREQIVKAKYLFTLLVYIVMMGVSFLPRLLIEILLSDKI